MSQFVCAFRGRRDNYQVPEALAESQSLDQFITDAYAVPWLRTVAKAAPRALKKLVNFRSNEAIPPDRVRCLWGTTVVEHLRHKAGCSHAVTFGKLDRQFAIAAAQRAEQTRSDLFLYSSYAWEAFRAHYSHTPRRVLFQYHPHPTLERRILDEDTRLSNGLKFSPQEEILPERVLQRERDCWKLADLIFCASTFTKRSLIEAGADDKACRVVPYGIDLPARTEALASTNAVFHAVFIGSGFQRKGLHYLLWAWQRARLNASSKLTLICRFLDPELARLAKATPRVNVLRGVSAADLQATFAASTLFVMPSLVEGFGQVYLEALAQGCPVLGTANTALPDLGDEKDGIFLVSPGSTDELVAKLEQLSDFLPGNSQIRDASRNCATRFPWPSFRQSLRHHLAA